MGAVHVRAVAEPRSRAGEGDIRADAGALNSALESEGHPPIADSQVCAPRYSSLLAVEGISAKMLGFVVDKQIGGATAITAGQ